MDSGYIGEWVFPQQEERPTHRCINICAHGIPKFTLYLARPGPFYRSRSPDSRLRAYLATRHGDLRQTLAQCPSRGHCLLFLHHRLRELTGKDAVLPDATDYYTRMTGCCHGTWWINRPALYRPTSGRLFVMRQSREALPSRNQAPSECFCEHLHQSPREMTLHPPLTSMPLK